MVDLSRLEKEGKEVHLRILLDRQHRTEFWAEAKNLEDGSRSHFRGTTSAEAINEALADYGVPEVVFDEYDHVEDIREALEGLESASFSVLLYASFS